MPAQGSVPVSLRSLLRPAPLLQRSLMNANDRFFARDAQVDDAAVHPLPNSSKIYVEGSRPDIRVPMREIAQSDTPASFGVEKNPPIVVYDTSGPYTDPGASIDIRSGLAPLRAGWIAASAPRIRNSPRCAFRTRPNRAVRKTAQTSRRCTMRGAASSRRKWSSSPSART
jgi:hypothetical protein